MKNISGKLYGAICGACIALGAMSPIGCGSLSGSAPVDQDITNAPTAGILGDVIGTNLSSGIALEFPDGIPPEILGLLNQAGALVISNKALIGPLTGIPAESAAIKAAAGAGAIFKSYNAP